MISCKKEQQTERIYRTREGKRRNAIRPSTSWKKKFEPFEEAVSKTGQIQKATLGEREDQKQQSY